MLLKFLVFKKTQGLITVFTGFATTPYPFYDSHVLVDVLVLCYKIH